MNLVARKVFSPAVDMMGRLPPIISVLLLLVFTAMNLVARKVFSPAVDMMGRLPPIFLQVAWACCQVYRGPGHYQSML